MTDKFSTEELYDALVQSLELQTHYARLLNTYDGGDRDVSVSESVDAWVARHAVEAVPRRDGLVCCWCLTAIDSDVFSLASFGTYHSECAPVVVAVRKIALL